YITHDLAVVSQMAHRIMVLRHGETVEEAPTREMLHSPRADYTRSLWAVRNLRKIEEPNDDTILRVQGISAAYSNDGHRVLDQVSLRIPRGRTVAIVGESGSGKSTIARVMTGLLPPTSGEIYFNGKLLPATFETRDREMLRRIQMVYQSPDTALNPRHTVRELIGRPLQFYSGLQGSALERRIVDLIEMIELNENHLERLPGELSGGQKQRVSLARALAADPDLVICDEVT
ncbi:MAG: ABC transporter ATP-binding protein, partial [Mesorhizobium sp.]